MATRLGFYTGRLYDDSVSVDSIEECCIVLPYKEPILDDEELVIRKRAELKLRCVGCNGCPESRKEI